MGGVMAEAWRNVPPEPSGGLTTKEQELLAKTLAMEKAQGMVGGVGNETRFDARGMLANAMKGMELQPPMGRGRGPIGPKGLLNAARFIAQPATDINRGVAALRGDNLFNRDMAKTASDIGWAGVGVTDLINPGGRVGRELGEAGLLAWLNSWRRTPPKDDSIARLPGWRREQINQTAPFKRYDFTIEDVIDDFSSHPDAMVDDAYVSTRWGGASVALNLRHPTDLAPSGRSSADVGMRHFEISEPKPIREALGISRPRLEMTLFRLQPEYRGRGIASETMGRFFEDVYNFKSRRRPRIKVTAGDELGGYAWVNMGYVPAKTDWLEMRMITIPQAIRGYDYSPEVKRVLKRILRTKNPKAMWALADLVDPVTGEEVGKNIMRGLSYRAVFDMSDALQVRRFNTMTGANVGGKQWLKKN